MKKENIALQLYSIRNLCEKDLQQTLTAVSDMGIKLLELAGLYNYTAKDFRKITDSLGQKVIAAHISIDALLHDYDQTVADYKTLGTEYIIVPWLSPEFTGTNILTKRTADILLLLKDKLLRDGLTLGFHNHWMEFDPHFEDGSFPWEILMQTGIIGELDVAWCHRGKHIATEEISKLPKTCELLHIKDVTFADSKPQVVGEGNLNWPEILACADKNNVKYYVIEVESWDEDRLGGVKMSYTNLLKFIS